MENIEMKRTVIYDRHALKSEYDGFLMIKANEFISAHKDWDIIDKYIDNGYSGMNEVRPEYMRLLKDCENGLIDIVFVENISRIARDGIIVEKFLKLLKKYNVLLYIWDQLGFVDYDNYFSFNLCKKVL